MQNVFYQWKFIASTKKRKYNKTLVWTYQNKKPFLKKNLKNLKKNSQKLKFNSVPHNDKDIESDNTEK